jgi:capsular exopolysaccharide synthesis family protein
VAGSEEQWEQGPSLVESVWRYRYRLLPIVVVSALLGYWLSGLQQQSFSATTMVLFREAGESGLFSELGSFVSDPERNVPQQAARVKTRTVLERAAEQLDGEDFESLDRKVDVQPEVELNRMQIIGSAPTPRGAAEIANAVGEAYETITREENLGSMEQANAILEEQIAELRDQIEQLDRRLANNPNDEVAASRLRTLDTQLITLETRASELAANAAVLGSGVKLREVAVPPEEPSSPQPIRDAAILAVLVLAIGSFVAYWRAGSHRKVEARTDPGPVLKVPLLGEVPKFSRVNAGPSGLMPGTAASEAYEFVLSSIEFSLAELDASSMLVTSAAPGDGKTATALHLAIAAAREERRVVLVDADVRMHGLTSLLRAEAHDGLVQLADGEASLDECIRRYRLSDKSQLAVVPAGRPPEDSTGLMRAPEFKKAMQQITGNAELIIVDSPPLLAVADASILAAQVDAIVLVVDRDTELEQLLKVQERLAFVQTPLIGYIYNRANVDRVARDGYAYGQKGNESPWSRLFAGRSATSEEERAGAGTNGQPGA